MHGSSPSRLPRRRRTRLGRAAAAVVASGAGLALAPAAMAAPSATVEVIHPGFQTTVTASTFTAGTIHLDNTSDAGETITSLTIDLADGPTIFPDLVFDPADGTPAGDQNGKTLVLDSAPAGVTLAGGAPVFSKPQDDGFGAVTADFDGDFAPGGSATMSVDIDPTSIRGSAGSAPSGPIAGVELQGATVSVTFSDGSTLTNDLSLIPGTDSDARAVLAADLADEPTIARAGGASWPVATSDAEQEIVITGPAGATGVLVVTEGHLDVTAAGETEGFDIDPFEANMAVGSVEIPFTIGEDGTVTVPVTLTDTAPLPDPDAEPPAPFTPAETGINHITAYLHGADGTTAGAVSEPIVMQLDPAIETVPPSITDVSPDEGQADVPVAGDLQVTFSEPMDVGTVTFQGAVTLTTGEGESLEQVPATITANEEGTTFTIDPEADLAPDTEYTATVTTAVTDVAGNALAEPLSWSFRTVKQSTTTPTTPEQPKPPAPTAPTGDPLCVTVAERPGNQDRDTIRLQASQLLINQRISQAAVRRANAVDGWLEAGIVAGDLCGNAFGPAEFAGLTFAGGGANPATAPAPRPLQIARGGAGGGNVTLSAAQLLINQRISQAAVRRVNALTERLNGNLTGGDLADGALTPGKLWTGLSVSAATAAPPVAKSQTVIGERQGGGGTVTLSAAQLQINQRISQAAVRRVNALADRLARGLTGAEFKDGTLTVADLAAEARPQQ